MTHSQRTPKQIVAAGYDQIAERYSEWTGTELSGPRALAVAALIERLPEGAAVLDLGCATGIPVAKALAERFQVTGVDLSGRQIAMARAWVPEATFLQGDMTEVRFPDGHFDGVISTFALTHVPRDEYPGLFAKILGWLKPGGLFVASLGAGDDPGTVEEDWLGAPMFFSGDDVATGLQRLRDAGFEIVQADEIGEDEDGMLVTFLWVVARKPEA